jgi:AraC-type transcriptional regulator N-terminus
VGVGGDLERAASMVAGRGIVAASEIEYRLSSIDLVSALTARTPDTGGNDGGWPGLTLYRFTEPTAPSWEEIQSLSLGIIAQGSKAVLVDGQRYVYDPVPLSRAEQKPALPGRGPGGQCRGAVPFLRAADRPGARPQGRRRDRRGAGREPHPGHS